MRKGFPWSQEATRRSLHPQNQAHLVGQQATKRLLLHPTRAVFFVLLPSPNDQSRPYVTSARDASDRERKKNLGSERTKLAHASGMLRQGQRADTQRTNERAKGAHAWPALHALPAAGSPTPTRPPGRPTGVWKPTTGLRPCLVDKIGEKLSHWKTCL